MVALYHKSHELGTLVEVTISTNQTQYAQTTYLDPGEIRYFAENCPNLYKEEAMYKKPEVKKHQALSQVTFSAH